MAEEIEIHKGAARPMSMLETVMLAVKDPEVVKNVAALRELLEMGKDLEAREAKKQYDIAFSELMQELPEIDKRGLIEYKAGSGKGSPYAKWDDIHRACMPILRKHGFAVSFDSEEANNKLTSVTIITGHGHEERRRFTVPWLDTGGSKSPAQAAASARTLAQRHGFCAAFNILTRDKDDDGSGQGVPEVLTEDQIRSIEDLASEIENREKGATVRFQKWLKVEFGLDGLDQAFQGHQHKAILAKLKEKMKALGIK